MIKAATLKNIYLFKTLARDQLELLANICDVESFEKDQDIFEEGNLADALYVIGSGEVVVHQKTGTGEHLEIAVLGPGSHFGEMSFIDGEPRSATVTIQVEAQVFIMPFSKLENLLKNNNDMAASIYKSFSNFLCGRLRLTMNDLNDNKNQEFSFF